MIGFWVSGGFRNATWSDFKLVSRKPILPTDEEIVENPRSRSAKMRVIERIK